MQDRRILLHENKFLKGLIIASESELLDVVFSSTDGNNIVIIRGKENYPDNTKYKPIGIVVVPGSHNRYGDGSCGVMSLVPMDPANPNTGIPVTSNSQTSTVGIYWGNDSIISTLGTYLNLNGYYSSGYIPIQTNANSTNCSVTSTSSTIYYPYTGLNGGSKTVYTSGALTECDGLGNTNKILDVDNASGTSWQNMTKLTGRNVSNYNYIHPQAECCWRYHTIGTAKGDWYLPALGEVTYIVRRRHAINSIITELNSIYGNCGILLNILDSGTGYFTLGCSTQMSLYGTYNYTLNNGYILGVSKDSQSAVRAFYKLK